MSDANGNQEPGSELLDPSGCENMDVEMEGAEAPLDKDKPDSHTYPAEPGTLENISVESKAEMEIEDGNMLNVPEVDTSEPTTLVFKDGLGLEGINADNGFEDQIGTFIGDVGLPDTKEENGSGLGNDQVEKDEKEKNLDAKENGQHIVDVTENEVSPKENEAGDVSVNLEENQIGDISVKSEENPIGDASENQLVDASVKLEENQTREGAVNSLENQNGDASVKSEENYTSLKSKDHQLGDALIKKDIVDGEYQGDVEGPIHSFAFYSQITAGDDSGTEEEQAAFMKELENFHKEKCLEFKPPKFYGEGLNCLKLWRAVTRLGGYEKVTSCKLWRQVGESFKPPKTCTTISWSFRCFYEKALLEYEKHKVSTGELQVPVSGLPAPVLVENPVGSSPASGSGRARRDAAARAMQGWHSQRLLGNGEVGDPIIKDKNSISFLKRDKQHKGSGIFKRKKSSSYERPAKAAHMEIDKPQEDSMVVDVGPPADWVKINVRRTKDCFEVYALVPGLLREEVHVQSDPVGRLVISGEPEQPDNPWGVTPFKKIVTLPSRIDPHQTSAIVTLHGQLFIRAPFEQSEL